MSYEIFYGKQFIKLRHTGEVIPMFLAGSNNCFEMGRSGKYDRRERDWQPFKYYNAKGKLSEKPDVILANADRDLEKTIRQHKGDKEATRKNIEERFGYWTSLCVGGGYCSDTSWNRWRSQFVNGIRDALTIEELNELGVHPYFQAYPYAAPNQPKTQIATEKEYFDLRKLWEDWQAKTPGSSFSIGFSPIETDEVLRRLREGRAPKAPVVRTPVEQDHFFGLVNGDGNYLIKYTPRGFRYGYHPNSGRRFQTEEEAEKCRKELVAKGRYKADEWKVKRIDQRTTFMVADKKRELMGV